MIRWVLAGIGDIAEKRVLPAILAEPRSELYGVVTRDPAKGARYASRVWTSFEDAIRDPAVDAVYLSTPVVQHAPQTVAALRAGKHVLCEKPTAMDYAQALQMQHTAEITGRVFGVAYYRRTYPKVLRARELVRQGAIGKPVLAELHCHSWFEIVNGFRGWLIDPRMAGGGPLYDIGSHRIDLLNFFFGTPLRATGDLSNAVHHWDVEDSASVLVAYAEGIRGYVDVRWHARHGRDDFRITGTDGEIDLSPLNSGSLTWPGGSADLPPHANLHYPCVENFVDAVLGKAVLASSGATALWTDWVTEQVTIRECKSSPSPARI